MVCWRIPALTSCGAGREVLVVVAEARLHICSDQTDKPLVLKRSTDGGRTWGPARIVAGKNDTRSWNPELVYDQVTGKLLLNYLANRTDCAARPGHCAAFQIESADCGLTWSGPPVSLAPALGAFNDGVRPGPGRGIQLTAGANAGRLLMSGSFDQRDPGSDPPVDLVWCGDDHGKTYTLSAARLPLGDESTLAELANGSVVINMRNAKPSGCSCRLVSISHDAGATFSEPYHIPDLTEPVGCQGSLLRDPLTGPDLFFSNPSSTSARVNMTVKRSSDGATWPSAVVVYPGASAYSCLTALPPTPALGDGGGRPSVAWRDASSADLTGGGRVGIVFEHGNGGSAYGSISFAAIDESMWAA